MRVAPSPDAFRPSNACDHGVAAMDDDNRNDTDGNSRESHCYVAICAACGYQWDETSESTFHLFCPVCDCNHCHRYEAEKADKMGEDYDGLPWY